MVESVIRNTACRGKERAVVVVGEGEGVSGGDQEWESDGGGGEEIIGMGVDTSAMRSRRRGDMVCMWNTDRSAAPIVLKVRM